MCICVCVCVWCVYVNDAVEAHSCIDDSTDKRFLSRTQLLMINQMQDVSNRRSFSTVYTG